MLRRLRGEAYSEVQDIDRKLLDNFGTHKRRHTITFIFRKPFSAKKLLLFTQSNRMQGHIDRNSKASQFS